MNRLVAIALRHKALYIPHPAPKLAAGRECLDFLIFLAKCGFAPDETLLHALNGASAAELKELADGLREILRINANWTPLMRDWTKGTDVGPADFFVTGLVNLLDHGNLPGTTLECGHFIPAGTFPLDRYNGCPYCGTPFHNRPGALLSDDAKPLKVLSLMTLSDMRELLISILTSPVAPDASRTETLGELIQTIGLPRPMPEIKMKETLVIVADRLAKSGDTTGAYTLLRNPADLLRFIWYRRTGTTLFRRPSYYKKLRDAMLAARRPEDAAKYNCRLHFSRSEGREIAACLNAMEATPEQLAEQMHPRRGMWVRIIRAARLPEFARCGNYPKLAELLNVFYRGDYPVFAGQLQEKYLGRDSRGLDLLARRPGLFARALFAWALRVGPEEAFAAFAGVMSHIPARLLYTLNTFAENYFVLDTPRRTVVPGRGFAPVEVPANPGLRQYSLEQRAEIAAAVKSLFLREMSRRYATLPHSGKPVYIAPALFDIPLPVGDRSNAVADFGALMPGQKFKVEGNELRVFLQWGNGLPAQHLDMDLSAAIIYDGHTELCAYFRLNPPGAVHSGDIRNIPDQIGTAEYIEIDCARLRSLGARYVVFTGNGYSTPNLSPNLAFGWMSSARPMTVDDSTGVAYDPAHVQHLAHLPDSVISQGMAFAMLDLRDMSITVIDLPFKGRTVERLSISAVEASLRRLRAKPTVGEMLALMAEATGRPRTDSPQPGCEIFDVDFISDPDRAAKLLLP